MIQKTLTDYQDYGCPSCNKSFDSKSGLGVHHSYAHGESLEEYHSTASEECPTCGETFHGDHGVKIHHKRAHGESIGGVVVECEWCGGDVKTQPCKIEQNKRIYCSRECNGKWMSENLTGEDGRNYRGGKYVSCKVCGDEFWKKPSHLKANGKQNPTYCSNECRGEDYKTRFANEGNPRWEGGRFAYGPGWNREKSLEIRIRDQARCVDCGISEAETTAQGIGPLHVHHVCGARDSTNPAVYNASRNLVSLCSICHPIWEDHTPGAPPNSDHYGKFTS